jgi:hypothetical protein
MRYRVGVDVGGTFTDLVAMDEIGNVTIVKASTTPGDQKLHASPRQDHHLLARLPKQVRSSCQLARRGGLCYHVPINGYAPGIPHAFPWSAASELRSCKRVRDLVEREEGQIFFGRDPQQFPTSKPAPNYYQ